MDSRDGTCADGFHDFMEPVIVGTQESQTFFVGFLSRETQNREVAITFCRRCGKQMAGGWTE